MTWLEGDFGPIRAIDGSEQSISRGFLEQNDQKIWKRRVIGVAHPAFFNPCHNRIMIDGSCGC